MPSKAAHRADCKTLLRSDTNRLGDRDFIARENVFGVVVDLSPGRRSLIGIRSGEGSGKLISKSGLAIFALGLTLVIIAGLATFPRIAPEILFSWDSATYVTNAQEYFEAGTLTGLIASYSQSLGNLAYRLNFNLLPEARLSYIGGQLHPVIMYLLASALFFTTAYVISVTFGFGLLTSLVSGLIVVLLTMPVTSPAKFSEMYWWHSPYAIPLVYQFAALVVTARFVGRLGT